MMRPIPALTSISPRLLQSPDIGFSCKPPWEWSRNEVREWLLHCEREYSLDTIDLKRFAMNGKALYILTKQDFIERLPSIGDILYNHIHIVLEEARSCRTLIYAHSPPRMPKQYDETAPPYGGLANHHSSFSQQLHVKVSHSPTAPLQSHVHFGRSISPGSPGMAAPHSYNSMLGNQSTPEDREEEMPENLVMYKKKDHKYLDIELTPSSTTSSSSDNLNTSCEQVADDTTACLRQDEGKDVELSAAEPEVPEPDEVGQRTGKRNQDGRLLWDFLSNLLNGNTAPDIISWEDEPADIFRIHDATGLAALWGKQKNRSNMTYEKMSRALRYYYKMNIIQKVKGKRLTYKFMKKPEEIRKNRGLALRYRAQQRKSVTHHPQTSPLHPISPRLLTISAGNEGLIRSEIKQETDMETSPSHLPVPPTPNGAIPYVHLDDMKPCFGHSFGSNSPSSPPELDNESQNGDYPRSNIS